MIWLNLRFVQRMRDILERGGPVVFKYRFNAFKQNPGLSLTQSHAGPVVPSRTGRATKYAARLDFAGEPSHSRHH